MKTRFLLVGAILAIAGCTTAEDLARADDAQCVGIGAQRGTDLYVQCRMILGQQRQQIAIARAQMAPALAGYSAAMMQAGQRQVIPMRAPVTCSTSTFGAMPSRTTCY